MYFEIIAEKRTTLLTKYGEKEIEKRKLAIAGWSVIGVGNGIYQVNDYRHGALVNLYDKTCDCMVWEQSGLPCAHAIMVLRSQNIHQCATLARVDYRRTYQGLIHPLPAPRDWEIPDEIMIVRPPVMDKRPVGRPRNTNRIPSQGEEKRVKRCGRCNQIGHYKNNCNAAIPTRATTERASGSRARGTQGRRSRGRGGTHRGRTQEDTTQDGFDYSTVELGN